MNTPLNVCMLLLILTAVVGVLATAQSPELLEQIGRKMRARSRALIASRSAWEFAYARSLQSDHETEELRKLHSAVMGFQSEPLAQGSRLRSAAGE